MQKKAPRESAILGAFCDCQYAVCLKALYHMQFSFSICLPSKKEFDSF